MKHILILVFITFALTAIAQDTIPDLITDRPDLTESSSVVPLFALQIETGFVVENYKTNFIVQKSFAYNTTLLRYGLLENLELRLGMEYLGNKVLTKNTDSNNTFSGLGPVYAGFKVKITEEDGWKPEIAFLGGLVLPFTADDYFKPDYTAANIRFSLSHSLSDKLSIGYNLGVEWDGETAIPEYFYTISLGIELTDILGMFVEGYGMLTEEGKSENLIDAGFTYLVFPNFQLDFSGGLGLSESAVDNFLSFGLTYRFPN